MKRVIAIALLLAFSASMSGCATSTVAELREKGPENRFEFVAAENYQPVYRKILEQTRKCHEGGVITSQMVVHGDLYHDIKRGTITVAFHPGLGGVATHQVIDVAAIDDRQTKVVGHYFIGPFGSLANVGQVLKEWALENSKECWLKKHQS